MRSAPFARPKPAGGAADAATDDVAPPSHGIPAVPVAAAFALLLLAGVWAWWAIKDGAYFGTVLYPGLALLCAGLIVLLVTAPWRADLSLSRPVVVALAGVFGLAAWSTASALWSPSADVAIADGQRIAGYGLCFVLGLWLCNLLGPRMHLALVPVAITGGLAGLVALAAMLGAADVLTVLNGQGTVQYPLGYRNANAAFFAIALWPALALARTRELRWPGRALALGAASLCVELALLSQSRGSIIGVAAALAVYVVVSSGRARALLWLGLAMLPALIVLPAMGDLYSTVNELGRPEAIDQFRATGRAALAGFLVAVAVGAVAARLEQRFPMRPETEARANRFATAGVLVGLVAAAAAFVIATGDPIDWVSQRVDEFSSEGSPAFEGESTRFSFNAGTGRLDLWRIALEDASADPLFGEGGGGFQYSHLRERATESRNVRDAHSMELEVLAELGIPGLVLLSLAIAGAVTGALRARRLGPAAALLSGAALTAGAYWLAHSSLDWFWTYPAVTAPVFGLLGAACAPAVLARRPPRAARRRLAIGAAALLAVSVVPPLLSELYTRNAFFQWREDPARAFADLGRAQTLNRLAEEPFMAEGAIALELGEPDRALAAFSEAAERRPDEWAAHYFLAQTYLDQGDLDLARRELGLATELNPLSTRLEALEAKLRAQEAKERK